MRLTLWNVQGVCPSETGSSGIRAASADEQGADERAARPNRSLLAGPASKWVNHPFLAMAADRYPITDQHAPYFLTMTVMRWIDLFTRPGYKHIITDSLNYCVGQKGLSIYAWVLMTNHLHLIARVREPNRMSDFLRDFKKYTSKALIRSIQEPGESRQEWLLDAFSFEARRTQRAEEYKVWQDGNHAIQLYTPSFLWQKVHYVHQNPVRQAIVNEPEAYAFSSATDYAGQRDWFGWRCFKMGLFRR